MSLALRYVAHSEIGLVRKNNQDSAYVSPTMLVVADGMGGAAAGDLASAVAIRELRRVDGDHTGQDMLTALADAISAAGEQISALVDSDPALDGMGSTVCGVMFDGTSLGLANIGDSRAYRFRDGRLARISRDHSWVQTLVDEGRITETEALDHPHRSLILRVINGQPQHLPDLDLLDARLGDRLLICSDGLCGMVTDADIEGELDGDLDDVLQRLVAMAHATGGQDNITIILADLVDGERVGPAEVLGAAGSLDLDLPFDPNTARIPTLPGAGPTPTAADLEAARYRPTTRHRGRTWLKVTLGLLLPLALIAGGLWAWYGYTQRFYFVGENGGYVAIFRGIPDGTLGLPVQSVVETDSTLPLAHLLVYDREQVQRAATRDKTQDEARAYVQELRKRAVCGPATATTTPTTSPTTPAPESSPPRTSPASSTPATPSGSKTPVVPPSPSPSPTPTPSLPEGC
ncbi:MAG TPA: protein phosphatase 2C domain-containing protein [Propionicimonas sp.]|jgi:protein phosphatase|nr:protein phosphatase 2C domain-containing protein [Propionicimonas sp.]